jgi:hypothetical protein
VLVEKLEMHGFQREHVLKKNVFKNNRLKKLRGEVGIDNDMKVDMKRLLLKKAFRCVMKQTKKNSKFCNRL